MLLLDKPLVSDFVKESIRKKEFSALDTGHVLPAGEIELLHEDEALQILKQIPAERIHTIAENSISWIEQNMKDNILNQKVRLFKDKHAFRDLMADLYPDFRYSKIMASEIMDYMPPEDAYPFIIKPNVGFFSMGVHKVSGPEAWTEVQIRLTEELSQIQEVYPNAVLNTTEFIIEDVIGGEEYAIDAYYDSHGNAVLLGVMHHLFGSETDVSDRVYLTSAEIVNRHKELFMDFLDEIGNRTQLKDFSLHIEARIDELGKLNPIEVNPLRFGAWCTSADLMHYAYNINPYSLYLNNKIPDWEGITGKMNSDTFGIIILENSTGIPGSSITSFNYDAALENFSDILEVRKIDFRKYPIFCILFARFRPENFNEVHKVLKEDLKKYLNC